MTDETLSFYHTEAVLLEYGNAVVELYRNNLKEHGHVATSTLLSMVRNVIEIQGNGIAVDLYLQDYWKYVEWDTRPHFPPHLPILEWVKAKRLVPTYAKTPVHRNGLPYSQEELQDRLAWAVQHKIAREGTKGTHDLAEAVEAVNTKYEARLMEALNEDIGHSLDLIIHRFQG